MICQFPKSFLREKTMPIYLKHLEDNGVIFKLEFVSNFDIRKFYYR